MANLGRLAGVVSLLLHSILLWAPVHGLFRNEDEKNRWLVERHHEQREVIHRSLNEESGLVHIIVLVNETCTETLPHEFNFTHGKTMTVDLETYDYLFEHRVDLCISMIESDPVVEPVSFVTGANDDAQAGFEILHKEYKNWALENMNMGRLSPYKNKEDDPESKNPVGVCIVDTGAHIDHPDFPYSGVNDGRVQGAEFDVEGGAPWYITQSLAWHGTFVTGIVCAQANNNKGTAGIVGDCDKKIRLNIARVFGKAAGATTRMSTVAKAVEWCVKVGSRVVNLSLATPVYNYNAHQVFRAIKDQNQVVVIAASGNAGPSAQPSFPAYHSEVISVGAVDIHGTVAGFSQKFVDVVAPGVNILSTATHSGVGFDSEEGGYQAGPVLFSAIPELPKSGKPCDCGCGEQCDCSEDSSICIIDRCPDLGQSVTTQVQRAEMDGCAGVVMSAQNQETLYSNDPDFMYQSSIPIVYVDQAEAQQIRQSAQDGVDDKLSISFAFSNYRVGDGTSFAAPYAAGLAALLIERRPECTADQIANAIKNSAVLPSESADSVLYGNGLIQGEAAYNLLIQEDEPCGIPPSAATTSPETEPETTTTPAAELLQTTPRGTYEGLSLEDMLKALQKRQPSGGSVTQKRQKLYNNGGRQRGNLRSGGY